MFDDKNSIILKNGSIKGSDRIYFSSNGKITSLNVSNGVYAENDGRYIYKGEDSDNYIWIYENGDSIKTDEELYRIISYQADGTIKVIRNERIKDNGESLFAWDQGASDYLSGTRFNVTGEKNTYCKGGSKYYGCNAWGNMSNTYFQGNLLGTSFYYKYYANNTTTTLSQNATNKTVVDNATLNDYLNNDWLNNNSNLNNYILHIALV